MSEQEKQTKKAAKTIVGKVVSNKMQKTVVVLVERKIKHPLYGKYVKRSNKFLVHDADGICQEGDKVVIAETRPISKLKRWHVMEKL